MKALKKTLSLLLALVMMLAMSVTAFADEDDSAAPEEPAAAATITIEKAVNGREYNIYQVFELKTYDAQKGVYSYKIVDAWKNFFVDDYEVELDANGYLVGDYTNKLTGQPFTQAALAYAETNKIDPTATATAENGSGTETADATVTFTVADGFYLVSSTGGAFVSAGTQAGSATIQEKNGVPTVEKTVNLTNQYVGKQVNYTVTVTVQDGAEKYIVHDTMNAGLSFDGTVTAKIGETEVAAENYTLTTEGLTDGCTFEIAIADAYAKSLEKGTQIIFTYTATITEAAIVNKADNEVKLQYNESNRTESSTTETKTYGFGGKEQLTKVDGNKAPLEGVKFELTQGETKVALTKAEGAAYYLYDVTGAGSNELITNADGTFRVEGLAAGTYTLTETKPLDGYNSLLYTINVTIDDEGNVTYKTSEENATAQNKVEIVNYSGSTLPSTGGIGTTIFYVVGGILVVVAGVLLVAKKRMSREM